MQPNDTLNIRLVNKLPPAPEAEHCAEHADLVNNPTNLHTHGLIVEPHRSTGANDPYGDYIFVEVHNTANHATCPQPMAPGMAMGMSDIQDVANDAVEYSIHLVKHPAGMFWFHPHMHGLALNQVSAGMAGVISVGEPGDECDAACRAVVRAGGQHVLVLKDTQVLADGTLMDQEDPGFCTGQPASGEPPRHGVCAGDPNADQKFTGGHWFHTINGQVYPSINVGGKGDLWRIVNAAGSRSYELFLAAPDAPDGVPLQVISIDGITIDATRVADLGALQAQLGQKVQLFRCPKPPGSLPGEAVCTRHVRMMPSSRVTVRVLNDKAAPRDAVLRTTDYSTGPDADDWPAIDLATVHLASPDIGVAAAWLLAGQVSHILSASGVLGTVASVMAPGHAHPVPLREAQQGAAPSPVRSSPGLMRAKLPVVDEAVKLGLRADSACANLGANEHRRIYFGNPTPGQDGFGLAVSIVGADGKEKPDTLTTMTAFDPTQRTLCLTASGVDGKPTTETWELINLTGEDHNFHIHQTRFWLLSSGPTQPSRIDDAAVLQDNVPVPHAADVTNCDGSVAHFASKACQPKPVVVRIPFTQIGTFVFHCHILEHEDGGMMARMEVVAPPVAQARP